MRGHDDFLSIITFRKSGDGNIWNAVLQICFCSISDLFFSLSAAGHECCWKILAKIDKIRLICPILYLRIVPSIVSVFQLHRLATCSTIMGVMSSSS
jgi:hypothetical protein